MNEFTKGPWSIVHHNWEHTGIYPPEGYGRIACVEVRSGVTEETQDKFETEKDANALLIAAAPDMYEALKDLLNDTEHREHDCGEYCPVKQAKAAIAKARGHELKEGE